MSEPVKQQLAVIRNALEHAHARGAFTDLSAAHTVEWFQALLWLDAVLARTQQEGEGDE